MYNSICTCNRTCEAVLPGIVTKCLNARPKTKQAAIDVCLMYAEIEQHAVVQVREREREGRRRKRKERGWKERVRKERGREGRRRKKGDRRERGRGEEEESHTKEVRVERELSGEETLHSLPAFSTGRDH